MAEILSYAQSEFLLSFDENLLARIDGNAVAVNKLILLVNAKLERNCKSFATGFAVGLIKRTGLEASDKKLAEFVNGCDFTRLAIYPKFELGLAHGLVCGNEICLKEAVQNSAGWV